jgi:hypothetical protein
MNDMLVEIPKSVKEFDIVFGKETLRRGGANTLLTDEVISQTPESGLIALGTQWRRDHRWQLKALAAIVDKAQRIDDDVDARNELESLVYSDEGGVHTFLTTTTPELLLKVLTSGCMLEDGEDFRAFLKFLLELPTFEE